MKKVLLSIFILAFVGLASAKIYQWKDKNGNLHFTDTPHKGAKEIELPEIQTYSDPNQIQQKQPQQSVSQTTQDEKKKSGYESVTISSPKQNATIRNNTGNVTVSVTIMPALRNSDLVQIKLDGNPVGEPQKNTSFILNNVYRGSHSVSASIVDQNDSVIASSDNVTFFMHRPRVNQAIGAPKAGGGGRH